MECPFSQFTCIKDYFTLQTINFIFPCDFARIVKSLTRICVREYVCVWTNEPVSWEIYPTNDSTVAVRYRYTRTHTVCATTSIAFAFRRIFLTTDGLNGNGYSCSTDCGDEGFLVVRWPIISFDIWFKMVSVTVCVCVCAHNRAQHKLDANSNPTKQTQKAHMRYHSYGHRYRRLPLRHRTRTTDTRIATKEFHSWWVMNSKL